MVLYWTKPGVKFCVRLRSRTQKIEIAPGGRPQIERLLARKTPQPSVIVAGLES
jgi:hypothetical protein